MNSLIGTKIKIFSKGGWEVSGTVVREDEQKIILRNKNIFFVYKESISILQFLEEKEKDDAQENNSKNRRKTSKGDDTEASFPQNTLNYSEYQMGLPESMLVNKDKSYDSLDDELHITFGGTNLDNKISFEVKNNEQKTRENKEENS